MDVTMYREYRCRLWGKIQNILFKMFCSKCSGVFVTSTLDVGRPFCLFFPFFSAIPVHQLVGKALYLGIFPEDV